MKKRRLVSHHNLVHDVVHSATCRRGRPVYDNLLAGNTIFALVGRKHSMRNAKRRVDTKERGLLYVIDLQVETVGAAYSPLDVLAANTMMSSIFWLTLAKADGRLKARRGRDWRLP